MFKVTRQHSNTESRNFMTIESILPGSRNDENNAFRACEKLYAPNITQRRHDKKIHRVKHKVRSELLHDEWSKRKYAREWATMVASNGNLLSDAVSGVRDTVPRIHIRDLSKSRFITEYEAPGRPVVLLGMADHWKACKQWDQQNLLERFAHQKFKVGEDDNGRSVYVTLKYFLKYCNEEGKGDDSPLYIFDPGFGDRKNRKISSSDSTEEKKNQFGILDPKIMTNDYEVPEYFNDDLFQLAGDHRRPPYRWIVIGPARSGTGIHIDPLGTSAWNTILIGYKRWCLFPPHIAKHIVGPPKNSVYYHDWRYGDRIIKNCVYDHEASTWFNEVYPNLVRRREELEMIEIIQAAHETVFVPGGWHHVVMNLTYSVAITQNFCSPTNFEQVYLRARHSRPKMTTKLVSEIARLSTEARTIQEREKFMRLVHQVKCLNSTPQLPLSSDDSSSSSSSSDSDTTTCNSSKSNDRHKNSRTSNGSSQPSKKCKYS